MAERPRVVDLELWYGWCTLRMTAGDASVEVAGHWFSDCFTDVLDAVADVLGGRRTACCRFSRELPGGRFVDFALDGGDSICVAVHETGPGVDGNDEAGRQSAARGALLFDARFPLRDFTRDFVAALRRIRVLAVDASGLSVHWPHTFPQCTYETLERTATSRFGHRATPTHEITGEDPRPWPTRDPS